jgi:branched-chain amino acid transport system substrate-binding protein
VVKREFTNDKATDLMPILTKIKSSKPDIIFYGGLDAVAGPMLRQMKQLGMKAKVMGGDGICTAELPKLAGGDLGDANVFCAEAGGVDGDRKQALEQFKRDFKAKNGIEVQIYAPYVFDAVNVMVAAMQKAGSADPQKYLPEMGKVSYQGITGPIAFDEKGDIKNGALTLYTYKGAQRTQIAVVR